MKYAIPIGLALGGVLSMLCGTYCIAADLELQQLGVDVDSTWSYLYTWVSCSMALTAIVTLEVVHQRECRRWDEEMSRLQSCSERILIPEPFTRNYYEKRN
jgi:hypothetical protein|tara:strand:- start:442 stop:744 length:303 start_codon:yes stop_codon:yes gene_type:complete